MILGPNRLGAGKLTRFLAASGKHILLFHSPEAKLSACGAAQLRRERAVNDLEMQLSISKTEPFLAWVHYSALSC